MNERLRVIAEQAGFVYIKEEGIGWAGNYNASFPKFTQCLIEDIVEFVHGEYQRDYDISSRQDLTTKLNERYNTK